MRGEELSIERTFVWSGETGPSAIGS
eukprot:COSAG01_NODE_10655_length_2087_cov_2.554175_1_plen_25_part_10